MKVLWILYAPLGELTRVLHFRHAQSGTWIDGAMHSLLEADSDLQLKVLTTAPMKEIRSKTVERVEFCCIPGGMCPRGKRLSQSALSLWVEQIKAFSPDLIHIWGTEFSIGGDLKKAFPNIPFVYRIQGAINAISKYPNGNLSFSDMAKKLDLVSALKLQKYKKDIRFMKKQAELELDMIQSAAAIFSDNEWAIMQYKMKIPTLKVYYDRLPIRQAFFDNRWKMENAKPYTLFCLAGRTAYKGIHQAIEAVHLLKEEFPDILLKIPGNISSKTPKWLFEPSYITYLNRLISEYGLEQNVVFLGQLTQEEMVQEMLSAQMFVMPSVIENESATLREAMLLGMPVISSFAGDIYETVVHGRNGFLYRYEEYELLAYFIKKLFLNPELAEKMGECATLDIKEKYQNENYGETLMKIYREVLV